MVFMVLLFFLWLIISLLKHFKSNYLVYLYILMLFMINFKGGNVFFIERTGIFIITMLFFYNKIYLNKC